MIPVADSWGPFADGIEAAERLARLRGLRATARLLVGPRGADPCHLLASAETDASALEPACNALNGLPALDRRQIWAAYAALTRAA